MNLSQLELLVALVETGNFSEAADTKSARVREVRSGSGANNPDATNAFRKRWGDLSIKASFGLSKKAALNRA